MFRRTIKPLLSGISCVIDKIKDIISISEQGDSLKTESETTETLNDFFSNISRYPEFDSVPENMTEPTLRAFLKCKDHPSILAIQCEVKTLCFTEVNAKDIKKEILKLNKNKASQVSDIPVKVIKNNMDMFSDFICEKINIA